MAFENTDPPREGELRSAVSTVRSRRWRRTLVVIGILLLWSIIEAQFPGAPLLDISWSSAQYKLDYDDASIPKFGDECPALTVPEHPQGPVQTEAGAIQMNYVDCSLECLPAGTFCEGLRQRLGCTPLDLEHRVPGTVQKVALRVTHDGGPFCYVPLYRTGKITFKVEFNYKTKTRNGDLQICHAQTGFVQQTTIGLSSCGQFRRRLGVSAAREIRREIDRQAAQILKTVMDGSGRRQL